MPRTLHSPPSPWPLNLPLLMSNVTSRWPHISTYFLSPLTERCIKKRISNLIVVIVVVVVVVVVEVVVVVIVVAVGKLVVVFVSSNKPY